jgi:uncharacterized protein YjbJ (UPF0337 family)
LTTPVGRRWGFGRLSGNAKETHVQINIHQIQANWQQIKGRIKERWGRLIDDDVAIINGRQEQLAGILRGRFGYSKEQAERELARAPGK